MRRTEIGWMVGALGVLVATGTARAEQGDQTAGTPSAGVEAQMNAQANDTKPTCKDAGVTVAFAVNSDELDQNARGALNGVATWLKADDHRTLYLEGFADPTGPAEANLVLSAKRADAVKTYLVTQGVDAARVQTLGKGEDVGPGMEHLPANGRAVTFLACQSPGSAPAVAEMEVPPAAPAAPATPAEPVEPVPVAVPVPAPAPAPPPPWASGFGWALMAGGNYTDYTSGTMRDVTAGGGGWDARFIGGTHSIIGFEAAYVGSAHSIHTLGFTSSNPNLVANGLEGNGRLNIPIRRGASLFEPYGFVGLGYSRYRVSSYNSATLSSFSSAGDNTMTFPVGGGFAYGYKGFIADVRAGWTGVYFDNIVPSNSSNSLLNNWNAGGQVGFNF